MFLRKTYLQSRLAIPDTGEHTTDIATREPITNLWLEVRVSNGATNNQGVVVSDVIERIDVIDGSDVIYSFDGYEAMAYTAYYCNCLPNQLITELPGNTQNLNVVIPFGRFVGDPIYAFDPTKFMNPQVRIKWNLAAIRAVGLTGFATNTARLTILANVMEGGETPLGYLMAKEIYSWVTAAGVEYIDLPTDYPYKALLMRVHKTDTQMFGVVSALKLHVNQEQFTLFNMRMTDFIRSNSRLEPILSYDHVYHCADGDTVRQILEYAGTPLFAAASGGDQTFLWTGLGIGTGLYNTWIAGAPDANDRTVYAKVNGYCPFGCLWYNFGRQNEPGDYFDAPAFRSVRLEATGAVAAGAAFVGLIQARPY